MFDAHHKMKTRRHPGTGLWDAEAHVLVRTGDDWDNLEIRRSHRKRKGAIHFAAEAAYHERVRHEPDARKP